MGAHSSDRDRDWCQSRGLRISIYDPYFRAGHSDWYARGEAEEKRLCEDTGRPWARLTEVEQARAGELIVRARKLGYRHLEWWVPHYPWPVGAVWLETTLWQVPVRYPYDHGAVVLTARHWFRRYPVATLRGRSAGA